MRAVCRALGDMIDTTGIPGMAATDTSHCEPAAMHQPEALQRGDRVFRT
jgi:hypothetical protein